MNGLSFPYVDYAVLDFMFIRMEIPQRGGVVVEDRHKPAPYRILGMNVIRHCWEVLQAQGGSQVSLFKNTLSKGDRRTWNQAFLVSWCLEAGTVLVPVEREAHLRI